MEKTKILFTGLFFTLLSFTNSLYAQSEDSATQEKKLKPTIALKDGATLFSADDSFNGQISNNKIVHDKASIVNQDKKNKSKTLEMVTPKEGNKKVTKNNESLKEANKKKVKTKNSKKLEKKKTS